MRFPRESGVLLHPTSLPGPFGSGDFGPAAFRFVDWLASAGQRLWQVMPLGPTGFGDSPYASPSAFAGNPLLVSIEWLHGDGLLEDSDLVGLEAAREDRVEFERVAPYRLAALRRAWDRFRTVAGDPFRSEFEAHCANEQHWLETYALFMAVKDAHDGAAWQSWDMPIRLRDAAAVADWARRLTDDLEFHRFVQFQFDRQWRQLRSYANERGIRIVGDIPIFVAEDSADVWANRDQFQMDATGNALQVAGVPPDPFSATGQIWGNPAFDWVRMREDGFGWWVARIGRMLAMVDIVRIDHFRGFAAAWLVPRGAESAAVGHWERSPGGHVFAAIRRARGDVPIIIEDLGVITPDVVSLRELLGFPGMNVLQFAFEHDPENVYLPHNYRRDSVVYTGTHDNQTTVGWFASKSDADRQAIQEYLGRDGSDIAWDMIRLALASTADTVIVPLQDVLRLGDEARMNVPGQPRGNWSWRFRADATTEHLAAGLRHMTWTYGRSAERRERSPNPWDYTDPHGARRAVEPGETLP